MQEESYFLNITESNMLDQKPSNYSSERALESNSTVNSSSPPDLSLRSTNLTRLFSPIVLAAAAFGSSARISELLTDLSSNLLDAASVTRANLRSEFQEPQKVELREEFAKLDIDLIALNKKAIEDTTGIALQIQQKEISRQQADELSQANALAYLKARGQIAQSFNLLGERAAEIDPELKQRCLLKVARWSDAPSDRVIALESISKAPIASKESVKELFELPSYLIGANGDRYAPIMERLIERAQDDETKQVALYLLGRYFVEEERDREGLPFLEELASKHAQAIAPNGKSYEILAAPFLYEAKYLAVGMKAPEVTATDADGKTFKLSDSIGRITIVDFWGFWCEPCMREMPHIKEFILTYPDITVIGVNSDSNITNLKEQLDKHGITWRNAVDGSQSGPWSSQWNIRSWPSAFLLDEQGVILAKGPRVRMWKDRIELRKKTGR